MFSNTCKDDILGYTSIGFAWKCFIYFCEKQKFVKNQQIFVWICEISLSRKFSSSQIFFVFHGIFRNFFCKICKNVCFCKNLRKLFCLLENFCKKLSSSRKFFRKCLRNFRKFSFSRKGVRKLQVATVPLKTLEVRKKQFPKY